MHQLLVDLGAKVVGEIIKKMFTSGMAWAANRKEEKPDIVELKLGQIAKQNLPATIPADQRQAVVTSLVDLVMPTFEQVVEYNPSIQRIKSAINKNPAPKKSAYRVQTSRKSAVRTHATRKATAGKKTATEKSSKQKSAPRR